MNNGSALDSTKGGIRKSGGCQDTDNNNNDFLVATSATGLIPRNSASPANPCGVATNNPPTITAPANPIATVNQDAAPFAVNLNGSDDGNAYTWSATSGTGVSSVNVTGGQGTANVTYTVSLQAGFTGTANFTASLSDGVNAPVTRSVNITVNPVVVANNPPVINAPTNPITTVAQGASPFTVNLSGSDDGGIYNWSAASGTGVSAVTVSAGQGTPGVTYTVTLNSSFSGTATFVASLSDNANAPVTQAVNIAVTPAPPPPADHVVISQIYGGGGNSGATYTNDYVELYNPSSTSFSLSGWSLQYASATGSSWTNKQTLGGNIAPGDYYLVKLASGGANGQPFPVNAAVTGDINMSATTGKIALVNNSESVTGLTPACPLDDPNIVDFVGYGTGATCNEGIANAPAPGNATALFRKAGGSTDTNQNGSDFVVGTPLPRSTVPAVEFGPSVVGTDPTSTGINAPHDATVTVNFSEPVDVVGNWYDISCAATGLHNDATVAHTSDSKTFAITPNVNFQFGEQCTATVFQNAVHDQDTDDSAPNTDTLSADYTWSFTVVGAGDPAPYSPDVHLTMGNPSCATADGCATTDINHPNNYLMMKPTYALSYNRDKGTPNWVSWHLDSSWYGSLARIDTFRPDPALPSNWYRVQATDYFSTGFDRGHMTPNADRDHQLRIPINQETYLMSNMVPQAPGNNQGPWAKLEAYLRTLTDAGNEIYIVSGPAGVGGTGSNGGVTTTVANGHVTVPAKTWKVALVLPKGDDDISRVTAATRTIAVIMPNDDAISGDDWTKFIVSVDQVESLTGYDFFSNVPNAVQNSIEAGINGTNPPGTADESVTTPEDNPASIMLSAISPDSNPTFTYTVSLPTHGTLSGAGSSRTYTPAPDFHGTDSFTFSVNDGHANSNTSTVTITVTEVNDPPVAADDSKSTQEDTPLTFFAGELLANDNTGAADETAQTLSVASVSAGADTHGTVALEGGQVTYTPELNFHGAASFTYQVCDDGTTAGSSDPRCANATVNVMVESVNDAPTVANQTAATNEDTAKQITLAGSDVDDDQLAFSIVDQPTHGTASLSGATVTYTPSADYNGTDSFTFKANDGTVDSTPATVSLTVNPVNDVPSASSQSVNTDEDTAKEITLAGSDLETSSASLVFAIATPPAHGHLVGTAPNLTYVPDANYNGSDSFQFTVTDTGDGTDGALTSTAATVSIVVNSVNDAPALGVVPASASISELSPYTFTATASDIDLPAQTLTFSLIGAPTGATINPATGVFSWTPTEAQGGTNVPFTFKVRVSDGVVNVDSDIVIAVGEVNQNPTLDQIGSKTVILGDSLSFTATGHDGDLPIQSLSYGLIGAPTGATINSATGAFSWTPTQAQAGHVYSFGVRVTDNGSPALYAEEQISVGAAYTWSGVLSPVNADGSSVFNGGRTVPVKFNLTGASAGVSDAVIMLRLFRIDGGIVGAELPVNSHTSDGNVFRQEGGQYQLNWDTSGLPTGLYQLRVDMGDGVIRPVNVTIR